VRLAGADLEDPVRVDTPAALEQPAAVADPQTVPEDRLRPGEAIGCPLDLENLGEIRLAHGTNDRLGAPVEHRAHGPAAARPRRARSRRRSDQLFALNSPTFAPFFALTMSRHNSRHSATASSPSK